MNLAALYVYAGIVSWIFVTGVGIVPFVPEEFAVVTLGVLTHKYPDAILIVAWLICVAAVLGTDLFLYAVGRIGGPRLMNRPFVQKFLKPERVQLFAHKFQQRGIWFMLTARLIPGWRSAVFITAGVIQYPIGRFCVADAISAVPLVTFFFFGGYFAADTIMEIIANIHRAQNVLLLIAFVGFLVVAVVLYLRWMRAREKEEEAEEAIEHVKMEEAQAHNTETGPVPGLMAIPPLAASGTEASVGPQSQ
ncbi:MAG TPA: DedA family protein [Gemmatales bacterium]|nr:DedA family protein [Gemmatales bacterium]